MQKRYGCLIRVEGSYTGRSYVFLERDGRNFKQRTTQSVTLVPEPALSKPFLTTEISLLNPYGSVSNDQIRLIWFSFVLFYILFLIFRTVCEYNFLKNLIYGLLGKGRYRTVDSSNWFKDFILPIFYDISDVMFHSVLLI